MCSIFSLKTIWVYYLPLVSYSEYTKKSKKIMILKKKYLKKSFCFRAALKDCLVCTHKDRLGKAWEGIILYSLFRPHLRSYYFIECIFICMYG